MKVTDKISTVPSAKVGHLVWILLKVACLPNTAEELIGRANTDSDFCFKLGSTPYIDR